MRILDRNLSKIIDFLFQRDKAPFQFNHFGLLLDQDTQSHKKPQQGAQKHGQKDDRSQWQIKVEKIQIDGDFIGIEDGKNNAENDCQD
jgi:hypothetical protein